MSVKAITPDALQAIRYTGTNIAIRVVGFDCYGRGFSDIRFDAYSALAEHGRLSRLGYAVGLVDHGDNWRKQGCVPVAERLAA